MECGEQCVAMAGMTMMPELYADNWGTMSTQKEVSYKEQLYKSYRQNRSR